MCSSHTLGSKLFNMKQMTEKEKNTMAVRFTIFTIILHIVLYVIGMCYIVNNVLSFVITTAIVLLSFVFCFLVGTGIAKS